MNCAEAYVKFLCQWLLDNCLEDMEFMADKFDKSCIDRLKLVASIPFIRVTYTEAVEILEEAVKNGKKFENEVKWGIDLASEHERYSLICFPLIVLVLVGFCCVMSWGYGVMQIPNRGEVSKACHCL